MPKWVKLLLSVAVSCAIFVGVMAFVYDLHPLGGGAGDLARAEACAEQARFDGRPTDSCYDMMESARAGRESDERSIAAASGAASVALLWLLAWLFYFRRRQTG